MVGDLPASVRARTLTQVAEAAPWASVTEASAGEQPRIRGAAVGRSRGGRESRTGPAGARDAPGRSRAAGGRPRTDARLARRSRARRRGHARRCRGRHRRRATGTGRTARRGAGRQFWTARRGRSRSRQPPPANGRIDVLVPWLATRAGAVRLRVESSYDGTHRVRPAPPGDVDCRCASGRRGGHRLRGASDVGRAICQARARRSRGRSRAQRRSRVAGCVRTHGDRRRPGGGAGRPARRTSCWSAASRRSRRPMSIGSSATFAIAAVPWSCSSTTRPAPGHGVGSGPGPSVRFAARRGRSPDWSPAIRGRCASGSARPCQRRPCRWRMSTPNRRRSWWGAPWAPAASCWSRRWMPGAGVLTRASHLPRAGARWCSDWPATCRRQWRRSRG